MARLIQGRPLVAGETSGRLLISHEPLSFWGGYDQHTGEIIDRRHPLSGQIAAGRVLAIPFTRGSSTTTAVLLEAIKTGTAPAALLITGHDHFLALASIVADELYGDPVPVIALSAADFGRLSDGQRVQIRADGCVMVVDR